MDLFLQQGRLGKPSLKQKNQLHGPRPSPLKLHKDSHKIVKASVAPLPSQRRSPIIIYAVSPKVIHTNPNEFMSLVQRLTGFSSATDSNINASSSSSSSSTDSTTVALKLESVTEATEVSAPNLFSPSVMDIMNSSLFLHEFSPAFHDSKGFVETAFMASPGSFFYSL